MSLHVEPNMMRLSVIGTGWSNTSIDSGSGFTIDGELWKDIALDLGYDFGDSVEWDLIANTEMPDFDWSEVIYEDADGNIYTDVDGDGIWTDPDTGLEYQGGGIMYISEDSLRDISNGLFDIAQEDSKLTRYSIPDDVLPTLYGGKVSTERTYNKGDTNRPHTYTPACWYIQTSGVNATLFLGEPFYHRTAKDGTITVYDDAFTTRDGSTKNIYYSSCSTTFSNNYLQSPYSSYPIQYVCWQCVYGSLDNSTVRTKSSTITTDSIEKGTSKLDNITVKDKKYYKVTMTVKSAKS